MTAKGAGWLRIGTHARDDRAGTGTERRNMNPTPRILLLLPAVSSFLMAEPESAVASGNVIRRELDVEQGGVVFSISYEYQGTPLDKERSNSLTLKSSSGGVEKTLAKMVPGPVETLSWDGRTYSLRLAESKTVICLVARWSTDGEDHEAKDLFVFSDGEKTHEIRPEMGVKTDYEKEIGKALDAFVGGLSGSNPELVRGIVKKLRERASVD